MRQQRSARQALASIALMMLLPLAACNSPAIPLGPASLNLVERLKEPPQQTDPARRYVTLSADSANLYLSTEQRNKVIRKTLTTPAREYAYDPDPNLSTLLNIDLLRGTPNQTSQAKVPGYLYPTPYTETLWIEPDASQRLYTSTFSLPTGQFVVLANQLTLSQEDPRFVKSYKPLSELWSSPPPDSRPTDIVQGLAVDTNGSLYFSVINEHTVYRLKDQKLEKIAGTTGQSGYVDGPAAEARFEFPRALEVDTKGNLYLLETDKPRIRKISPDGSVSTLAGGSEAGYKDGKGSEARFNKPFDLAINAQGDVFVSDTGNHRIRKIAPDGTVTTVIGTGETGTSEGGALEVKSGNPMGLDFAPDGTLYYIAEGQIFRTRLN